jgi:hypothetical protein
LTRPSLIVQGRCSLEYGWMLREQPAASHPPLRAGFASCIMELGLILTQITCQAGEGTKIVGSSDLLARHPAGRKLINCRQRINLFPETGSQGYLITFMEGHTEMQYSAILAIQDCVKFWLMCIFFWHILKEYLCKGRKCANFLICVHWQSIEM